MKRVLITFGTKNYERGMNSLANSARQYFDEIRIYRPSDIDENFSKENANVLSYPRGAGYWLWKPYFINKTLLELNKEDIVFYSDALINFTRSPEDAFEECIDNKGILCGSQIHLQKVWTKRDCFILMNADKEEYWDSNQLNAASQIYQKNDFSMFIVDEWLKYCKNEDIITDSPSKFGAEFLEWKDHRHDQSILSIIFKKYDIKMHKDFTQYGDQSLKEHNFMNHSRYECFLNHHRCM